MSAESKLINAICKNGDIGQVLSTEVEEFFSSHEDIWQSLKDYYFEYKSVPSAETLKDRFEDFEVEKTTAPTEFYIDELRNEYINGKLQALSLALAREIGNTPGKILLEELQSEAAKLYRHTDNSLDVDITDYEQAIESYEAKRERAKQLGTEAPGIPTGVEVIDRFYPTGMAAGHYICIIGWSSKGKSLFSTLLACRAWNQGFSPMIVSLEMTPDEIRDRIYTIMGSGLFSNRDLNRGDVDIDNIRRWGKKSLEGKPKFTIVSTEGSNRVTPAMVQAKIDQHRPDLVINDYMQLFDDNKGSKSNVEKFGNISRDFKLMATRNGLPMIVLSQATAEDINDTDQPPRIENVRWSKSIEHDATLAIAVHKYPDTNMFAIVGRKNRFGELFEATLDWDVDSGVISEGY